MKKLVVPTDFSENALSALLYAVDLCPILGTDLEVIHVYALPDTEVISGSNVHQVIEDWMQAFIKKGRKKAPAITTDFPVQTRLVQGLTEAQIVYSSNAPDVEMIVMGAEGGGGIGKKWFGSVAETVARQAHCPVLLIPEGVSFTGFRHILFASDYNAADPSMLDLLTNFAGRFQASIHFVHVETPGEEPEYAKIEQRIMDHLFKNGTPAFSFEMTCLRTDDFARGLEQYSAEKKIDLLVMVATQRKFWETLLHHSRTKEMILQAKIPLMVFHLGD
ncbi:MAG: universal stress protein [Lewinellaceae bacterium]|nr:universal stress protein [Lewinellaceae bacterium]